MSKKSRYNHSTPSSERSHEQLLTVEDLSLTKKYEDRQNYVNLQNEQALLLDKYILLTAGTLFNVALLFVDRIVPLKTADFLWIFIIALILLALAMSFVLFSLKIAAGELGFCIDAMDKSIKDDEDSYVKIGNCMTWRTRWILRLNILSLLTTVVAIISLSFFITYNLYESTYERTKDTFTTTTISSVTSCLDPPQDLQFLFLIKKETGVQTTQLSLIDLHPHLAIKGNKIRKSLD